MNPAGALLLVAAWSDPTALPCREAAVSGDQQAVALVRDELGHRGIALAPNEAAAALRVSVAGTASGLRLELRDRDGRVAERSVASPAMAAALIESWLRKDIAEPLLIGHAPPGIEPAPADRPADAPAPALTATAESSIATDGSLWAGASVGACLRFDHLCTDVFYQGSRAGGLQRYGADALVGAEWPIGLGRSALIPGVAAGAGWLVAHTVSGDHDGSVARLGFAAEARATLSMPLSRAVSLEVGLSATLYPFAHRSSFSEDGFTIPGNPIGRARVGLGLRYGHR
jgi:hypothetical protein